MANKHHKMWQSPWGFKESIAIISGLILIGLALQVTVGQFNFYLLSQPINKVVGVILVIISVILGLTSQKNRFSRWLTSITFSTVLIIALTLLSIVMGLTSQRAYSSTILGIDSMTSNWAFIIVYLLSLLSLGGLIVCRARNFKFKDYSFYLNHLGLWILLVASGLGYADMERYIMYVEEGSTQWRVYGQDNEIKELPIAIKLIDFDMDVYPPKLVIIDNNTGEIQPDGKPEVFQIEQDLSGGKILGWDIKVEQYIHQAVRSSDSTYKEVPMAGSTPAILVTASKGNITKTGWICGGNSAQIHMTLPLDDKYNMVMTTADARTYSSKVEVFSQDGKHSEGTIEVNHPLTLGDWMIYQYGYDNQAGNMSSYSSFELVYDPYLRIVYLGIIMLMLGSATMLWTKKKGARL